MAFGTSKANTAPEIDISRLSVGEASNDAVVAGGKTKSRIWMIIDGDKYRGVISGTQAQLSDFARAFALTSLLIGWQGLAKANELPSLPDYTPTTIANVGDLPQYAAVSTGTKTDAIEFGKLSNPDRLTFVVAVMSSEIDKKGVLPAVIAENFRIAKANGVPIDSILKDMNVIGQGNQNDWVRNISEAPKKSFKALTGYDSITTGNIKDVIRALYNMSDIEGWLRTSTGEVPDANQFASYRQIKESGEESERDRWIAKVDLFKKENPELLNAWIKNADDLIKHTSLQNREAFRRGVVQSETIAEIELKLPIKDRLAGMSAIAECVLLRWGGTVYQMRMSDGNYLFPIPQEAAQYGYIDAYKWNIGAMDDIVAAQVKALKKSAKNAGKPWVGEQIDAFIASKSAEIKSNIAQLDKDAARLDKDAARLDKDIQQQKQITSIINRIAEELSNIAKWKSVDVVALNKTIEEYRNMRNQYEQLAKNNPDKQEFFVMYEKVRGKIESIRPLLEKQKLQVSQL